MDYEPSLCDSWTPGVLSGGDSSDVLMQWTGRKDCTKWEELTEEEQKQWREHHTAADWEGKEIFEDDIVDIEGVGIAQVMMQDGRWVTYREDCMEVGSSLYGWLVPIKVIGNVYEQPELLK